MMTKEEIFAELKINLLDVLPGITGQEITADHSLKSLGANSLDRAEIIIKTMANLKLTIPLITLVAARNIGDIVTIFHDNIQSAI